MLLRRWSFSVPIVAGFVLAVMVFTVAPGGFAAGDNTVGGGALAVPMEGSAAARARALWLAVRPLIHADAQAALTDAEYLARSERVRGAWQKLDWEIADSASEAVGHFSRKVWLLVGDLYGNEGTRAEYRLKVRERTRRRIEERLEAIDALASSLE